MASNADASGKVRITRGDEEAFVLPESVHVWEKNGFTVSPADEATKQRSTRELTTTKGDKVTVPDYGDQDADSDSEDSSDSDNGEEADSKRSRRIRKESAPEPAAAE